MRLPFGRKKVIPTNYETGLLMANYANRLHAFNKCQRFAPLSHMSPITMKGIVSMWPFYKWGLDIVGTLPLAMSQKRFFLVVTNYFYKWIEVEPLRRIRE